jgi:hypothetical protein
VAAANGSESHAATNNESPSPQLKPLATRVTWTNDAIGAHLADLLAG